MSDHCWNSSREFSIPSDAALGKQAIDDLLAHLQQQDWGEQNIFGVHLAVEEAMVNAIKHGNCNDQNKKVHISYKMSPTSLRIEISDEGKGFNPSEVPDPTDDENLELPSGRGIMLMRSFMSFVEYNNQGNSVVMEKHCAEAS